MPRRFDPPAAHELVDDHDDLLEQIALIESRLDRVTIVDPDAVTAAVDLLTANGYTVIPPTA